MNRVAESIAVTRVHAMSGKERKEHGDVTEAGVGQQREAPAREQKKSELCGGGTGCAAGGGGNVPHSSK